MWSIDSHKLACQPDISLVILHYYSSLSMICLNSSAVCMFSFFRLADYCTCNFKFVKYNWTHSDIWRFHLFQLNFVAYNRKGFDDHRSYFNAVTFKNFKGPKYMFRYEISINSVKWEGFLSMVQSVWMMSTWKWDPFTDARYSSFPVECMYCASDLIDNFYCGTSACQLS